MNYIIPRPQISKEINEKFVIKYNTGIYIDSDFSTGTDPVNYAYEYAKLINETLKKCVDEKLEISQCKMKELSQKKGIIFEKDHARMDQGYKLIISSRQIKITAGTREGLLYAVQSLRQLILQFGLILPGMEVEDYPLIQNRGFYHDATRGRIQTLDAYKKLADALSLLKINQLQLYIEHSFMFKDFSEVWRDDTPLTAEDILELDVYCKNLCIDLVPSIATFGHLYKVLKTKSFEELCELENMTDDAFSFDQRMQHHTLNVADERSVEFVKKMLDEFLPLFSSQYVNICADETFDLGKGRSKTLADKKGVNWMYVDMVNKLANYIIEKGKTPMFWGDIIIGCPEFATKLPQKMICLNWGYGDKEREENTTILKEKGMQQYLCPGVHGWRHMINRMEMAYANISLMCGYALKHGAIGVLNTDWGDYGHLQDPLFSIPGMIYGACFSWSGVEREQEIDEKISRIYYGDKSGQLIAFMKELDSQEAIRWEEFVQYKELTQQKFNSNALDMNMEVFEKIYPGNMEERNAAIDEAVNKIYALSNEVNKEGKILIRRLALFADGQKLLHDTFELISKIYQKTESKEERFKLAGELEKWMYEYKKVWRESSRESELYRIEEVFYWYADALRR